MKKRITSLILCLALAFVMGGGIILSAFSIQAEASESTIVHSNVLDDLKKDSSFIEANYAADLDDHSMKVIQIAESDKKELFIYVYHPSNVDKDIKAKKINMALQDPGDKNLHYDLYDLAFINSNRVFSKYKVLGLQVSDMPERYYSIAGIYRDFDESLGDTLPEAVDTRQYKSYSVAQAWCCYYYNDKLVYEMEKMNVLEIDVEATGEIRYDEGFILYYGACDSHYIAFTPKNYDIAKIYDADVEFTYRDVTYTFGPGIGENYSYGDPQPGKITLKNYPNDTSVGSNSGAGLFGKKYTWKRIQTKDEFIRQVEENSREGFVSGEKEDVNNSQFVFQFFESEYTVQSYQYSTNAWFTEVSSISIVRMYFLTKDGRYYNLGVVHDLVGTDGIPDASVTAGDNILNTLKELIKKMDEWFEKLILIVGVILIVVFLNPIIKIFEFIINSILRIVRIITAPIRILFNRRRN